MDQERVGLTSADEWQRQYLDDALSQAVTTLDRIEERAAEWLVPGWLPKGQITLLAGDGGTGKSYISCDLAAAISAGRQCIMDPPNHRRDPALVALLNVEDSVAVVLKKRLRLAGANEQNVLIPDLGALDGLKLGSQQFRAFTERYRPTLAVIDPIQGFLDAETNMASRNQMRSAMADLIRLGEQCGTSFLVICHSNKRKGASGRDRISDSSDLWDISRSVLMGGFTGTKGERYLSQEKSNYGPLGETILYGIENGVVRFIGQSDKRDADFAQERLSPTTKRQDCSDWVQSYLSKGAVRSKSLIADAATAGYSQSTFDRAKSELVRDGKIKSVKRGDIWYIVPTDQEPQRS